MKVRHEVDATTLKRPKRAVVGATLALAIAASSAAAPAVIGAKARHDAMRPGVTNTR